MTKNCTMILSELGPFVFDNENELIYSKKFKNIISSNILISNGDYSEILDISDKLRSYDSVFSNDIGLISYLRNNGINIYVMPSEKIREISKHKLNYLIQAGFAENERDAHIQLRQFALDFSSSKVRRISEKLDLHISQSINALDELDKIINVIGARLREWYGLHFPELDYLIQNIFTYAEIVRLAGNRNNIDLNMLENLGIESKRAEMVLVAVERSKGGDILEENLSIIKKLANEVIMQTELRRILAHQIEEMMEKIAPNLKDILTATVGARLMAKAGSLQKLSIMPSSTIQIIGAEKALFRSLKTGAPPPKHGILFQHPILHSAPKWQRGKMARAIASKVAIAVRIDLFRNGEKDLYISEQLNKRIAEIQEKYKEPRVGEQKPYRNEMMMNYNRNPKRRMNKFTKKYAKKNKFSKRNRY
ncbi:MAG: NOP5/NOP56 family protein [Nitrososphaeraceae archaeon]